MSDAERIDAALDAFTAAMRAKLHAKRMEGYFGWDDPTNSSVIYDMMLDHANRGTGQEVDVANLAMMLWWHREGGTRCS